jgi:23S rRNA pseudouridine2605 synthase
MCAAVGYPVLELERVALGPLRLGDLALGQYRKLTEAELKSLKRLMV